MIPKFRAYSKEENEMYYQHNGVKMWIGQYIYEQCLVLR